MRVALCVSFLHVLFPIGLAGQSMDLGEVLFAFGQLEGRDEVVIGKVGDVAAAPEGDLLVLDSQAQRVGWIRPDGVLGGWFGREGDGPEEFKYAGAVAVWNGRFLVSDPGHQRIVHLRRGPRGLEYDGATRIDIFPEDFCVVDDRLFVLGLEGDRILHEFDWHGDRINSFGHPLETDWDISESWQLQADMYSVRGELVCVPEKDLLVVVPGALPEVRAFTTEGQLIWEHQLAPWKGWAMQELSAGRYTFGPKEGDASNSALSAFAMAARFVAVQIVEVRLDGTTGSDHYPVETRLLSADSGTLVGRQEGIPRARAVLGDRLIGWEPLPFPQVLVLGLAF